MPVEDIAARMDLFGLLGYRHWPAGHGIGAERLIAHDRLIATKHSHWKQKRLLMKAVSFERTLRRLPILRHPGSEWFESIYRNDWQRK